MIKIHLSQILKPKNAATYGTFAGMPSLASFVPEPCKGCSQWRGSPCYEANGDLCWHVRDWLYKESLDKQV